MENDFGKFTMFEELFSFLFIFLIYVSVINYMICD